MGNSKSGALSKDLLEDLKLNTMYSEEQLCTWYKHTHTDTSHKRTHTTHTPTYHGLHCILSLFVSPHLPLQVPDLPEGVSERAHKQTAVWDHLRQLLPRRWPQGLRLPCLQKLRFRQVLLLSATDSNRFVYAIDSVWFIRNVNYVCLRGWLRLVLFLVLDDETVYLVECETVMARWTSRSIL